MTLSCPCAGAELSYVVIILDVCLVGVPAGNWRYMEFWKEVNKALVSPVAAGLLDAKRGGGTLETSNNSRGKGKKQCYWALWELEPERRSQTCCRKWGWGGGQEVQGRNTLASISSRSLISLFFFSFWPHYLAYVRDLSSLTRDRTWALVVEAPSPKPWTAREFPLVSSWYLSLAKPTGSQRGRKLK